MKRILFIILFLVMAAGSAWGFDYQFNRYAQEQQQYQQRMLELQQQQIDMQRRQMQQQQYQPYVYQPAQPQPQPQQPNYFQQGINAYEFGRQLRRRHDAENN